MIRYPFVRTDGNGWSITRLGKAGWTLHLDGKAVATVVYHRGSAETGSPAWCEVYCEGSDGIRFVSPLDAMDFAEAQLWSRGVQGTTGTGNEG